MLKEVIINGISICIQEFKTGSSRPTIIFLHDSPGCIQLWRSFPQELGELTQCNVLVYDRQGYPERCTAIITEGAHIFVEDITLAGIRDAVAAWQTTDLKQKLEKYHGEKTAAVFHAWTDTWLSPSFRSWNIEQFLPSVQCPVLVMQGDNDEFGSIAQVEGILSGVSGKVKKNGWRRD